MLFLEFSGKCKCQAIFQEWYGAYDVRVRVCFVITVKLRNILHVASFSNLFEGSGSTASTRTRSHHWKTIPSNVGCRGSRMEEIPSLQHSMLLHLVPSAKRIQSVRVWGGLLGVLFPEVLL
jgi:hypothetical protein